VDVRPARDLAEFRAGLFAIGHFFGWEPDEESAERFSKLLPLERMLVADDDGSIVAGAGGFPFEMTVPGGAVPTAGVTVVGVLPTHRRRGILTAMMRRQLDDARAAGEHAAALWASEATIYGRFGYGIASWGGDVEIAKERTALARGGGAEGRVRLLELEDALEAIPPLYDAVRAETPGMMSRTREWWELRRLRDDPANRGGGGPLVRALLELDGEPAAYALYRVSQDFSGGVSNGHVNVLEAMGPTPAGTREIWRYLLDFDWTAQIRAGRLPVDHELLFLLAEPRRMNMRLGDALWVRLVDVGAALNARSYAGEGTVVFEVADAFIPDNAARWRVADGHAEQTDELPHLRLDVTALGSTYLGGVTFGELVRAGRIEELQDGGAARADAMFRAERAPWCPEIF
jgi:predicted acetyltransferase